MVGVVWVPEYLWEKLELMYVCMEVMCGSHIVAPHHPSATGMPSFKL